LKSARNALPTEPAKGVTCGIDWARDDNAVSIVDHCGREIVRSTVEHNVAGLRELLAVLERAGVREVAIERPDGPVVDTLLDDGVTVVVISPNQVKNLRGRYGSAGNKDDRFDAFVLTDTLGTDRARLHPLLPDTAATVTLRQTCRARKDLVAHRVAVANQLRAHLKIVFPTPESLAFLAGVAPSTRQSGKVKHVGFRWAADKQLRDAVTDFAGDSRHANLWAADLHRRAIARGHDHPHAVRILARAWLYIIWHCWQDGAAYDPAKHRAFQTLLSQDQHRAA
jgi:transposase